MNLCRTVVLYFVTFLAIVKPGLGQTSAPPVAHAETTVDATGTDSQILFSIEVNSQFGGLTYLPNQWGELHLDLQNTGETPREFLCTSYFADKSALQFGREVWLPAHSRLRISHPALLPGVEDLQEGVAEIHSLLVERLPGSEVLIKDESGQLKHDRSLLMTTTDRNTGIIAGWESGDSVPQDVLDLVIGGRVSQGLTNRVSVLAGQFLPADETSLGYLDHIVLMEDRLLADPAALTALRRWVHAGGRLWVMLDRVDVAILEQLLGDEFPGFVADRVSLSSVRIDKAPSLTAPEGEAGETIDYDVPVDLAQLVISGMKVRNTLNGWPVAITESYGAGRILITTLGPRGWIKAAPARDPKLTDERPLNMRADFVPISPMEDLTAYVFAKRTPEPLPAEELAALAEELVAYRIPTSRLILGTMGGFVILLLGLAIWLWRRERLEHFGWIGSLISVMFGFLFTGIGLASRYAVPETIARVQLVQAIGGADDARTQGVVAVYRREGSPTEIRAADGGTLLPEIDGQGGAVSRMVTTDLGKFHWQGLAQPAGLQVYPEASATAFVTRMAARGTVDTQGISGRLTGGFAVGGDSILATRTGRIGVTMNADGQFTAEAANLLGPDQYLAATLLGDVQSRRRRILQRLFENPTWRESLSRPQLLLWVNDWEDGFQFGEGLEHHGETLLAVPVELTRPSAGAELLIPSPLVSYQTRRPPDGSLPAGCWDDSRGEWQERSNACTTWLGLQIPRELQPLKVTRALLDFKVTGAIGQLEVLGIRRGAEVSLQTVKNPVGVFSLELADPDVLEVSIDGQLTLGIAAGVEEQLPVAGSLNLDKKSGYWRIESLNIQLWATATEINAEN